MVTKSRARKLGYKDADLMDASFRAGVNDGDALAAGQVGELAVAEVGEDGSLEDFVATILGQSPDPTRRTAKAKPFINVHDSAAVAEIDKNTEVRVVVRNSGDRDGPVLMQWRSIKNLRNSDPSQRKELKPQQPIAREGKLLAVQVRNQATGITPDFGGGSTEFDLPIRASEG